KLFDRLDQLQGGRPLPNTPNTVQTSSDGLAEAMLKRADARAHGDIVKIFEHYLETVRRQNLAAPPTRSRSPGPIGRINIHLGPNRYHYIDLNYPTPNEYYDQGAITLLRNAYEIYKRDDLLSDLVAEFRSRLNKAGGAAKEGTVDAVMLHLGLAYLYWWSGDKEQASQELAEASARAPQDLDLRLEVAALRQAQGEAEAGAAVVEGITPLDHTMMQKRET